MNYTLNKSTGEIFSPAGKFVGKLGENYSVTYAPGMKSAHRAAVEEFLAAAKSAPNEAPAVPDTAAAPDITPETAPGTTPGTAPGTAPDAADPDVADKINAVFQSAEVQHTPLPQELPPQKPAPLPVADVGDIPDSDLPRWDRVLGTCGKEFKAFVKKHHLNAEQTTALVRRLEKRRK